MKEEHDDDDSFIVVVISEKITRYDETGEQNKNERKLFNLIAALSNKLKKTCTHNLFVIYF